MPNIGINTFAGGELTSKVDARFDIEKHASGCRKLENFLPEVYGDVQRRPGIQYLTDMAVTSPLAPLVLPHTVAIANVNDLQAIDSYSVTFDTGVGVIAARDVATYQSHPSNVTIVKIVYATSSTGTVWYNSIVNYYPDTAPVSGNVLTCGAANLKINAAPAARAVNLAKNYYLINDIDASATATWSSGAGFNPLGDSGSPFTGTLDGQNYTISGLRSAATTAGLFGACTGATLYNFNVTGVVFSNASDGAICCEYAIHSVFTNITVGGSLTSVGGGFKGGFVCDGDTTGGLNTFTKCAVVGVTLSASAGYSAYWGLFNSICPGVFTDCYASGAMTMSATTGGFGNGGFTGDATATSTFTRCYATGTIPAQSLDMAQTNGGFAGKCTANTAVFTDCQYLSTLNALPFGGSDEVQTFEPNADPTGGHYHIIFDGITTGAIDYHALQADVQAACDAAFGTGAIEIGSNLVEYVMLRNFPTSVYFRRQYARSNVANITFDISALTSVSSVTVAQASAFAYPSNPTTSTAAQTIPVPAWIPTGFSTITSIREHEFIYSSTVSYVLILADKFIKFMYNGVLLTTDGNPPHSDHSTDYYITSPYTAADLFGLQFKQLGDTMWITHKNYAPRKLMRIGASTFALTEIPFKNGPFLLRNDLVDPDVLTTAMMLVDVDKVGDTGTMECVASTSVEDSNGDQTVPLDYFEAGHIGALFLLTNPAGTLNIKGSVTATGYIGSVNGYAIQGAYTIKILGVFSGSTILLEKSNDSPTPFASTTTTVHTFSHKGTYKATESSEGYYYRLHVTAYGSGTITGTIVANTNSVVGKMTGSNTGVIGYPIDIKGDWRYQTDGNWDGTLVIERNENSAGWEPYRTIVSLVTSGQGSYNESQAAVETEDNVQYRANMLIHNNGTIKVTITSLESEQNGVVQITSLNDATSANITVLTRIGSFDPTRRWFEGAWSPKRNYPACITFHEGRIVYGGMETVQTQITDSYDIDNQVYEPTEPTLWLSHSDDFENFEAGELDADSYEIMIKSTEEVMWIESLEKLFCGTGADEWLISANKLDAILTPTNTTPRKHSSYGSSPIQPLNMLDSLLFVDKTGQHVREITYEDKNSKDDLSLLTDLVATGIKSWCVQEGVETIIWCFLRDGTVVTMTYDPTEKIKAWAKQPIAGDVLTGCVIPGLEEDNLYLGIQRTINGATPIYIEKLASWDITTLADCFFVDCGKTFTAGSPTTAVTGATHLIGETVSILGDGIVQANKVVDGSGNITIATAASKVQYGLAYTSLLQPFRLVINNPRGGTSFMSDTKLSNLKISLYLAGYIEQSSDNSTWYPIDLTNINWTNASDITGLLTGDVEATSDSGFDSLNPIYIRSNKPLPLTIRAVVCKLDITS